MKLSEKITGEWVRHKDLCPMTNLYGRRWMTADGSRCGVCKGDVTLPIGVRKKDLFWHFPVSEKKLKGIKARALVSTSSQKRLINRKDKPTWQVYFENILASTV